MSSLKITVPLSKLPPGDAQAKELVAFEVSFGWHASHRGDIAADGCAGELITPR